LSKTPGKRGTISEKKLMAVGDTMKVFSEYFYDRNLEIILKQYLHGGCIY
jgi:hypothetical protein